MVTALATTLVVNVLRPMQNNDEINSRFDMRKKQSVTNSKIDKQNAFL